MAHAPITVGERMAARRLELREQLWPKLDEEMLWLRKKRDKVKGFTTIPRTLPLILRIMDELTKNKPVSSAYLDIWARSFDEGFAEIESPREAAFSSGFSGERAESTWMGRVRLLEDIGFIKTCAGTNSRYQYVLIFNPYKIIMKLHKAKRVQEKSWIALFQRAQEIGATDLKAAS